MSLLLFVSALTLPAQNKSNVLIYVPPVTGTGSKPEDNGLIELMLKEEIRARNYITAFAPGQADYSLIGALSPYRDPVLDDPAAAPPAPPPQIPGSADYRNDLLLAEETEFTEDMWFEENVPPQTPSPGSGYYVLYVRLVDEKAKTVLAEQDFIYHSLEDLSSVFSLLMFNIFSWELTANEDDMNTWYNKRLYLGISVFWTPRLYDGTERATNFMNFGGGGIAELHVQNYFSFSAGIEAAPDWIIVSSSGDRYYRNMLLEIPLALNVVVRPSSYLMVEPYGGIIVNIPLYDETNPARFSWMAGLQYGVKAGQGVFYIDPRFSMDFTESSVTGNNLPTFRRTVFHIGIGYKFGFFPRSAGKKQ